MDFGYLRLHRATLVSNVIRHKFTFPLNLYFIEIAIKRLVIQQITNE